MEEKSKLVEEIPGLLDFRANTKGGIAVAGVFVIFLFTCSFLLTTGYGEAHDKKQREYEEVVNRRMENHEKLVSESLKVQEAQVRELLKAVNRVENAIETFVQTQKLVQQQAVEDIEQNRIKLNEIERVIIRKLQSD